MHIYIYIYTQFYIYGSVACALRPAPAVDKSLFHCKGKLPDVRYVCIFIYVCTYIYIYIYIHMYVCVYIYIYT